MTLASSGLRAQPEATVPTVTPRRSRRFGVCAGCQTSRLVRRDGLVCRHAFPWDDGMRCPGENTTPIPIPIPGVDTDRGDVPFTADGRTLDRWDYLSLPLRMLLLTLRAHVLEVPAPRLDFKGEIHPSRARGHHWVLRMPIGQDPLERDLLARGLLAVVHGVDVSDWPTRQMP